jgi:predicted polyphosphate/ATP-dependent NAD kinase
MEKNKSSEIKNALPRKKIGLLVNPIAGMGGPVGLKGTDGKEILNKAISLGAKPVAPTRAQTFLSQLEPIKAYVELFVGSGAMGQEEAQNQRFAITTLGISKSETTAEDTRQTAEKMQESGVDLLVFCGGDGTARDVLTAVGMKIPVLGVPTGVKMHSAVFAVTPVAAAIVAMNFLWRDLPLREAEVMDVNETKFRGGRVSAELYGYVLTPYEPALIQTNKLASPITENEVRNQAAIAVYIIEIMNPDTLYIIGPGTTTRTIADLLDQKKTLLGVDLFFNKKIVAHDVTEKQILEAISGKDAQIIVTPIGGQGFIFGRGNQQISPGVIQEVGVNNILVIATNSKISSLKSLRVDTGNNQLDDKFKTIPINVMVDYKIEHPMKVE